MGRPSSVITQSALKQFPTEIREIVLDLVNNHGVRNRLPDGNHLFLYDGRKGSPAFKLAASRPKEHAIPYLHKWAAEHVPEWGNEQAPSLHVVEDREPESMTKESEVLCSACQRPKDDCDESPCATVIVARQAVLFDRKPVDDSERRESMSEPIAEPKPKAKSVRREWVPFIYTNGTTSECLEVRKPGHGSAKSMRCTKCDFTKEGTFTGASFHEKTHSSNPSENAQKAAESRLAKREEREEQARASLTTLAAIHGLVVVSADQQKAMASTDVLRVENRRLQAALDEVQTKLSLIQEAMRL